MRAFGDEFASRLETVDGYAAIYDDSAKTYVYATLKDGAYVSTGVSVAAPAPEGLAKHLREAPLIRRHRFTSRYGELRPAQSDGLETFGANAGLLTGRQRNHGAVRGLTILVEFDDVRAAMTADDLDPLMNADDYRRHGNFGSVRNYFKVMSAGKLDYTNTVVGPVRLSHDKTYYDEHLLVEEAIECAIAKYNLDLEDFATQLPGEPRKVVDAINILYAGESWYTRTGNGNLWPHNHRFVKRFGNVETGLYMLTGAGNSSAGLRIGTICHENGHLLCRFPDIYDYGNRDFDDRDSEGMGYYCLMGAGNHLGYRAVPAPICAYLRRLAGWTTDVELEPGKSYDLRHGEYGVSYLHRTGKNNEYFLLENRSPIDFDRYLPDHGLAVLHCDTMGSNEWQDGTQWRHYQCALLQADGKKELEGNINRGAAGDLYRERTGVFLSGDTTPHSRTWDGSRSGLILRDCSGPGKTMTIAVGPEPAPQPEFQEQYPFETIPDDAEAGLKVTMDFPAGTSASRIQVWVEILHTWRQDLELHLQAPDGKSVVLRERDGGSADDIRESYDSDDHPTLGELTGDSGEGTWTLWVRDLAARDVGELEAWAMQLG